MIQRLANKVKNVDATVDVYIKSFSFRLVFGNGNDRDIEEIHFDTFKSLYKFKPTRTAGNGSGILAVQRMSKLL